ncbi:LacI family DNA-binding transcriptional regulator [Microbacterium sp. NC79]|uniref:LacI family DNA-binding transcriptional regulator n=1 Tax=Microbacterium sp. NC79 TaxID=2851009 RepID=UPI001C2C991C|nr:LacI family DNA-binding transcriptional regulator [Microbacterium sp. NC79]MBV0896055.1 LacI family DNA-binding transcriptional regulator [Microbacterium sp. NC79]
MAGKVTIADVARAAGVSASTASVVFSGKIKVSDETAARVRAAAAELGYRGPNPRAASLRTGRSGVVGVVLTSSLRTAFLDPIAIATMDGIATSVAHLGAGILLLRDDGQTPAATEVPLDAAVIFGSHSNTCDLVQTLRERGIPVVTVEGDPAWGVPVISLDNTDAQAQLAHHLSGLGHRDVAVVSLRWGPNSEPGFESATGRPGIDVTRERLAGVREVFDNPIVFSARGSSVDFGIEAARAILDRHQPTAILAQSDLLAAGVIRAATERGLRVPEDLSVTGFDGVAVDGLAPYQLTTLHQPAYDKGRAVGDAISRLLHGENAPSVRFTCTFRPGNTTAPPPQSPVN